MEHTWSVAAVVTLPSSDTRERPKSDTLHVKSEETNTLRAARSRCTIHNDSRYAMPEQVSTHMLSRVGGEASAPCVTSHDSNEPATNREKISYSKG